PDAVTKTFCIQPTLARMKDRSAEDLPAVDPQLPEHLVTHALALVHAYALFRTASRGLDALPSYKEEGNALRAILQRDAEALIQRGLMQAKVLRGLKHGPGYCNLAFDLQLLTQAFRACEASTTGLTSVRD